MLAHEAHASADVQQVLPAEPRGERERASTRRRRDVLDLKGEDLEKKARLVGKVALLETENFDEENSRCLDASKECSITFRLEPQPIWNANEVINGTAGVLNIPHPITGQVDAGFVCKLGGIELSEDHWMTRAEALIQKHPDPMNAGFEFDVVHHFNMFSCFLVTGIELLSAVPRSALPPALR